MEVTYYFLNNFHRDEEVKNFLVPLLENIIEDKSKLTISTQEESEEGEGDTLYIKCEFFSFTTTLFNIKSVVGDYDIHVNYGLDFNIYENGNKKFLEFLGYLLKSNEGEALLLKDYEYIILERKKHVLIVDNCFFQEEYEALNLTYTRGIYKKIFLRIETSCSTEQIKFESTNIVKNYVKQDTIRWVEDPDYSFEFTIQWGDVQIHICNLESAINLTCNQIFNGYTDSKLKKVLWFFKQWTMKFNNDYELRIQEGYWEPRNKTFVARKNGVTDIKGYFEESPLLTEINFESP